MRIAIAGGGGLGYLIAKALSEAPTAYSVVVLSRYNRPDYAELGVQVLLADYSNPATLEFSLQGVGLVISVVRGPEQLVLINAAARAGVQLFVPSEFEGKLSKRSSTSSSTSSTSSSSSSPASASSAAREDPLDPGGYAAQARHLLRRHADSSTGGSGMRHTVFSCGVFMERFHPAGLAAYGMGQRTETSDPGAFLLDLGSAAAEIVDRNGSGQPVRICLTSVYDVAMFVVAAVQLGPGTWGREWTMRGDRMSLQDLVGACGRFFNTAFQINYQQMARLPHLIAHHQQQGDYGTATRYQRLLATAAGRYDFGTATLNDAIRDSQTVQARPARFRDWLARVYPPGA